MIKGSEVREKPCQNPLDKYEVCSEKQYFIEDQVTYKEIK